MKTENQGTLINNINYDNIDNAKIIEEALKETEVLDLEKQEIKQEEPPQEMYQQPPQQIYQQPPQQMYQQPPQQMYQQPPQQIYQQPEQMYQQQLHLQEINKSSPLLNYETNNNFLKNFQHSFILLIILILFNNDLFKGIISKIPFTTDIDGNQKFLLFFLLFTFIFLVYFLYLSIFN